MKKDNNGLAVIVRNLQEYEKIKEFLTRKVCYLDWLPQMAETETAIVIWAKRKTDTSTGSHGSAEYYRETLGIRTVEFKDFFKL